MKTVLKHIVKVEYIEARYLQAITVVPGVGVYLNIWRNFKKIETVGLSSTSSTSKISKRNYLYDVKLSAIMASPLNKSTQRLCYRLTCADGTKYLLGLNTAPYPITNITDNRPSAVSDKSAYTLNVSYSNTVGLLSILDY